MCACVCVCFLCVCVCVFLCVGSSRVSPGITEVHLGGQLGSPRLILWAIYVSATFQGQHRVNLFRENLRKRIRCNLWHFRQYDSPILIEIEQRHLVFGTWCLASGAENNVVSTWSARFTPQPRRKTKTHMSVYFSELKPRHVFCMLFKVCCGLRI